MMTGEGERRFCENCPMAKDAVDGIDPSKIYINDLTYSAPVNEDGGGPIVPKEVRDIRFESVYGGKSEIFHGDRRLTQQEDAARFMRAIGECDGPDIEQYELKLWILWQRTFLKVTCGALREKGRESNS